jgi:hypothetical protein
LEAELISLFAENEDQSGMENFVKAIGIDNFFSLLPNLIQTGTDGSFISSHILQEPSEKQILLDVAEELEQLGYLQLLTSTLEVCQWKEDEEILVLRAKLLCLQSQIDEFCSFLSAHGNVSTHY